MSKAMIQSKMSIMNLIRQNYLNIYYVTIIHLFTNIKHDETNTRSLNNGTRVKLSWRERERERDI